MDKLDPNDARPPFRQLALRLAEAIEQGEYPPGTRLPSYGQLAERYDVAIGTAKRAVGALRDDGLVVIRQGMGTYVRTLSGSRDDGPADNEPMSEIRDLLAEMNRRLAAIENRLSRIND